MRPSEAIAWLRRELEDLEAYCDVLKGALAAHGVKTLPERAEWARDLTPQQRALVGALFEVYPRRLERWALLEAMPSRDHVADRCSNQVSVVVRKIRLKLGPEAICHDLGGGYWLGPELYARIKGERAPLAAAA